ncbi:MAG TPA: flagellar hook-length control protein FliK [bacterium]|nr:flagellar hook-length control protein FliK [bacterium]
MNANDVMLGILASQSKFASGPLSLKAESFTVMDKSFQSMFNQALSGSERVGSSSKDTAAKAESTVASTGVSGQEKSPQAVDERPVSNDEAVREPEAYKAEGENKTAEVREKTGEQIDANEKLEAIVDRLEEEIAKGEEAADEEIIGLLTQILALLMEGAQQALEGTQDAESNLTVTLNLDRDSKIYEILDMLMNGQQGLNAEDLENVNVLLKLSDEKGLMIPLSELVSSMKAESDEEAGAMKLTLELSDSTDAAKVVKLDLMISAQDMKDAQIVDLADPALKDSDLVMMIPLERLAAENAVETSSEDLDALMARVMQESSANDRVILQDLETKVASQKSISDNSQETSDSKIIIPLKTSENNANAELKVTTSDPMYLSSDEYLKGLDMEALAKELATAGKKRQDIYNRLQQMIMNRGTASTSLDMSLMQKVEASLLESGDLLQDLSQQIGQDENKWASSLIGDEVLTARSESTNSSDRIPFMGRPAATETTLNEVLESKATARSFSGRGMSDSVMNQLMQKAAYTFTSGTDGEVRVILSPAKLGDIHLKVRVDQDIVTAKFTAASQEVKAIIESNMGQLKQALDEMGVKVGSFEVEVNTGTNDQPQNGENDRTADSYSNEYSMTGEGSDSSLEIEFDGLSTYSVRGMALAGQGHHSYLA